MFLNTFFFQIPLSGTLASKIKWIQLSNRKKKKKSIFLCYSKEGKYKLVVTIHDVNTHNPPPSPTPNAITFDLAKTIVFTLWITVTVSVMFTIHQAFQTALFLKRIQKVRSWCNSKPTFLAFLLLALFLSSMWIFSLILHT